MFRKLIFSLLILIVVCSKLSAQQKSPNQLMTQEKSVKIPGTNARITPPEHFELSDQFQGFIHVRSASTIQVTAIDTIPYFYLSKSFTKEELATQGATLISREEVKTARGDVGIMVTFGFIASDTPFERIMLITGDYEKSVIVNANYPKMGKDVLFDVLKKSVLSIEF